MGKGEHLGEFEQLVLLALARLGVEGYGMDVRRELEGRTGREVTIGAVYATLDRLERKRLLSSLRTDPEPRRGGRARRLFRIEPAGRQALRDVRSVLETMWDGVALFRREGS